VSDFEPIIEAQLAGASIVMALLIEADFVSQPMRLWTGEGARSFGGRDWQGIGAIVSVSDITRLENGQADPFEVTITADEEIIRRGLIEFRDEAMDRALTVSLQFLNYEAGTALGAPWQLRDGVMRGASLTVDTDAQTLSIKCDTLSSRRNRPALGMLTDRDQQSRFPGDLGLTFVHTLDGKEIVWPVF